MQVRAGPVSCDQGAVSPGYPDFLWKILRRELRASPDLGFVELQGSQDN